MIYFCESSNYILAHDNRIYIFMSVFTYIIIIFVVEICFFSIKNIHTVNSIEV